ncbi:MAG: VCBS repeat-containing protein [Planctomycetes bacterium]|nr:VCBS repeat-containing protein [Planctomycetota bacterium]
MLRRLFLMGLLVVGGPVLFAGPVQDLTGEQAEELADSVGPVLGDWLSALASGKTPSQPVMDDFRAAGPGSRPWMDWGRKGLSGKKTGIWNGPQQDFAAWWQSLADPIGNVESISHTKSKIIGVRPGGQDEFSTAVLWELSHPGHNQVWIELEVDWIRQAEPNAISARILSYAVSSTQDPMFVERTKGVFSGDPFAAQTVALGGREWAQSLDDSAASAWFGHQGMAVGDVNGDGLPDLYLGMPSGVGNLMLVQQPDGSVRDWAHDSGVDWYDDTKGVLLIDLDGDGDRDLVTTLNHFLVLHANDGKGKFEVRGWCAAPDESAFYSIAAADVDQDGDLDLFGTRYVTTRYGESIPVPFEDATNGPSNHLFLNQGEFRFVDGTAAMGLAQNNSKFSLAASFEDFDGDGDCDLYVANDFGRNQLFRNDGKRFVDVAAELGVEDQAAGMGVSWADADGDGDMDLHVSNMFSSAGRRVAFQGAFHSGADDRALAGIRRHAQGNSLWLQGDDGKFIDASDRAGIRMGRWSWGTLFTDLNGDGQPDLYGPNGFMTGVDKSKSGDL